MELDIYNETRDFFSKIIDKNYQSLESFDLGPFQNLDTRFHIGDFYYFIFNCRTLSIDYVSDSVTQVLGYDKSEIQPKKLLGIIHPDDLEFFKVREDAFYKFLLNLDEDKIRKYKLSYDIRLLHKDGIYRKILHQMMPIEVKTDKKILRTINIQTDISELKRHEAPIFSIIGFDGEPSYNLEDILPEAKISAPDFTKREKEILRLVLEGLKSAEISEKLFISLHTVNNHRKILLHKTNCKSVNELILRAISENWLQ